MLGDAFGKLFSFIGDFFTRIGGVIWDAISWIGRLIWDAIKWIGDLLTSLFQLLIDIIVGFFEFIYAIFDAIFYFIYNVGLLAVKLFSLFFEVGKLIISFVQGIGRTLQSLVFTPSSTSNSGYSDMLGKIFNALEVLQLNVIAYILMFLIWIGTAFTVVKILSNLKGD